jgi:protein-tyrosine phosphatase
MRSFIGTSFLGMKVGKAGGIIQCVSSNRGSERSAVRQIEGYPLWLGNIGDARNVQQLYAAGIRAVVDLAADEAPTTLPRELLHCRFPLVDGAENPRWLLKMAAETVAFLLRANVPTLVHCGAGMSRTPAIAAGGLVLATGTSLSAALSLVVEDAVADVSPAIWNDVKLAVGD